MSVAVVVPWRPGCPHREAALEWVAWHEPRTMHLARGGHPWVKAEAVMPTIREWADPDEIVVMQDADVFCDGLDDAIAAVESGAIWAVPHLNVHRLTSQATAAVLRGAQWRSQPLEERPYPGVLGGGYVVARRETFLDVPLDSRFVGWGNEDESWGLALGTLLGPPWRGTADLVHLWHPPQQRLTRTRGNKQGWLLRRRYIDAMRDHQRTGTTDAMRSLLGEAHDALKLAEPSVCH